MAATKRTATEPEFNAQAFLAKVGSGRTLANHSAGEIVFSQGDAADAIFYVRKGKVKLTVISRQGKEAVIAMLGAGDFFGEGCLAGQTRRMATCRTMSPAPSRGWRKWPPFACSTKSLCFRSCSSS